MKYRHWIALIFTLACSLIIGIFSILIYYLVEQHTYNQFENRLEERAILAGQVLLEKDELNSSSYNEIVEKQMRKLPEEEHYIIRLDGDSVPYQQIPNQFQNKEIYELLQNHLDIKFFKERGNLVGNLLYKDNEGNFLVIITAKDQDGKEDVAYIKKVLISMFLITTLLIGVLANYFSRLILLPVSKIIYQLKAINANKLDERLKLKKNHDKLYELSKAFNTMLSKIEDSFESQKQFIHNASHELRTPLTIILGETDLALQDKNLKAEQKNTLLKIQLQAEKLRNLIKSLLELASLNENELRESFCHYRFDESLQEALNSIFEIYPDASIDIQYKEQDFTNHAFEVFGNAMWMEIAFYNIIHNSLKYSKEKKVSILLEDQNEAVQAEIIDNGIGINNEDLRFITKAFYRGKNAYFSEGTGIGLAISNQIVQLQKGELKIFSEKQSGTRVIIKLPK
ncbi:MAG: HAMP domain-containing histidine kinase [Flavobacteriaceae bacterium]|nr:HAMP domain-containing histidine kinase [Flavobacteriaceae bacterium]